MHNHKYKPHRGRKVFILKGFHTLVAVLVIILATTASIIIISRIKSGINNEKREILRLWNSGEYEQAFISSKDALFQKPTDNFLLTINGFSAFQLGISQINSQNMLSFIDECIFSLRKALIKKESSGDGRIYYVLGKAYGYKGNEYSDLAVKYLLMSDNAGFAAPDIPEYLGLAYAAFGDYRNSVASFSKAFTSGAEPSDALLLSIARSYMAMEEYDTATGYLKRCIEISPDSNSIVTARLLLAEICKLTGDYENAEAQYFITLADFGENAEVHYQLGELYNLQGNTTRARAEWRLAYRLNPAHSNARVRLNI
ncbi:MAG: tetratricopeptide repeat protein [Treponema sp.]|nr:tetratricopeptide repeat protein [Treponema sp.]